MKGLLAAALLLTNLYTGPAFSFAEDIVIYRWVDENNVVHFSQHQPEHDNYIMINTADKRNNKTLEDAIIPELASEQTAPTLSSDSLSVKLNARCQEAKKNLITLQTFKQVQVSDGKGQVKMISGVEKQEQTVIAQKQIEVYCK